MDTATLGRLGEEAAARWYSSRGFAVVARNWRCREGELDLVVRRGGLLVIGEVKTRRGACHGGGWEAVTLRKQRKVRMLAARFLREHPGTVCTAVRFDVASVARTRAGFDVQVFEDAF